MTNDRVWIKSICGWLVYILLSTGLSGCRTIVTTPAQVSNDLVATFLDAGQGSCLLYECPGGGLVLNDCGTVSGRNAQTKAQIVDFIVGKVDEQKNLGVTKPLTVVVSHPDRDHYNIIYYKTPSNNQIDLNDVSNLYIGDAFNDYNVKFRSFFGSASTFNRPDSRIPLFACGNAQFSVLAVNSNTAGPLANPDSIALLATYQGKSILTVGDATGLTQDTIKSNWPAQLALTVLAASHHGADTEGSNDTAWAAFANPEYVIIQSGEHNGYQHPRCSSIDNYDNRATRLLSVAQHYLICGADGEWKNRTPSKAIYSTAASGTITVTIQQNGTAHVNAP